LFNDTSKTEKNHLVFSSINWAVDVIEVILPWSNEVLEEARKK